MDAARDVGGRCSPVFDEMMRHDPAWRARISLVLSGALRVWGVPGTVTCGPEDPDEFIVAPDTGPVIHVHHHPPGGWIVVLRDPVSGAQAPPDRHAGLQGLLRQLREDLAPHAPAGRLVIGVQPLFGRGSSGR